jgi:Zinc carboxypeptidase
MTTAARPPWPSPTSCGARRLARRLVPSHLLGRRGPVFLLGNIHPPEAEAAEALLMLARDLAAGPRRALLDRLVVIIAPVYKVDGTDTFVTRDGDLGSETPYILGVRENSEGLDLNRDAVKLTTVEGNGLYRTLNAWDPLLFLDGHVMSRGSASRSSRKHGAPDVRATHLRAVRVRRGAARVAAPRRGRAVRRRPDVHGAPRRLRDDHARRRLYGARRQGAG